MDFLECDICYESVLLCNYDDHREQCLINQRNYYKEITGNGEDIVVLTNAQQKAMEYAQKKSKIYSKNTKLSVLHRFKMRGLGKSEIKKTIDFIQKKVQIIIHVNLTKNMRYYLNDDYYRNLFEVNNSGGCCSKSARETWEKNLFSGLYDGVDPVERVKYGAMNLTNCDQGVNSCCGYGDSYFVLKNKVKDRTTFVFGDSSSMMLELGTFNNCGIILSLISDDLLNNLIKVATGECDGLPYSDKYYTEIQIHGLVRFFHDIDLLVVNNVHKDNNNIMSMVKDFSKKYNVPYKIMNTIDSK